MRWGKSTESRPVIGETGNSDLLVLDEEIRNFVNFLRGNNNRVDFKVWELGDGTPTLGVKEKSFGGSRLTHYESFQRNIRIKELRRKLLQDG